MEYEIKVSNMNFKNVIFEIFRILSIENKFGRTFILIFFAIFYLQLSNFLTNIVMNGFQPLTNILFVLEQLVSLNQVLNNAGLQTIITICLYYAYVKSILLIIFMIRLFYLSFKRELTVNTMNQYFFKYIIIYNWILYIPEMLILLDNIQSSTSSAIVFFDVVSFIVNFIIDFSYCLIFEDPINRKVNLLSSFNDFSNLKKFFFVNFLLISSRTAIYQYSNSINLMIFLIIIFFFSFEMEFTNIKIDNIFTSMHYTMIIITIIKCFNNLFYFPPYFFDICTVLTYILLSFIYEKLHKRKFLISVSKRLTDIKDEDEMSFLFESLFQLEDLKEQTEYKSLTFGIFQNHYDTCIYIDCPLKKVKVENCFKDLNKFNSQSILNQRPFLIYLGEVFNYLESKFKEKFKYHFYHLLYLLTKIENISLALVEIQNISKPNLSLKREYIIYNISYITNNLLLKSNKYFNEKNRTVGDIIDVIYFDELFSKMKDLIFKICDLKKRYYKIFLNREVNLNDIFEVGQKYILKREKTEKIWSKIENLTKNNFSAIKLYAGYIGQLCQDKEKSEIMMRSHKTVLEYEKKDLFICKFHDDSCFITVELSKKDNIGQIVYVNQAFTTNLGYQLNFLKGKQLSLLLPPMIASHHKNSLKHFLETGIYNKSSHNYAFIKHKSNYFVKVNLIIFQIPCFEDEIKMTGLFRTYPESDFAITNEEGVIQICSKNLSQFLNLKTKILDSYKIYLQFFIPEYQSLLKKMKRKPINDGDLDLEKEKKKSLEINKNLEMRMSQKSMIELKKQQNYNGNISVYSQEVIRVTSTFCYFHSEVFNIIIKINKKMFETSSTNTGDISYSVLSKSLFRKKNGNESIDKANFELVEIIRQIYEAKTTKEVFKIFKNFNFKSIYERIQCPKVQYDLNMNKIYFNNNSAFYYYLDVKGINEFSSKGKHHENSEASENKKVKAGNTKSLRKVDDDKESSQIDISSVTSGKLRKKDDIKKIIQRNKNESKSKIATLIYYNLLFCFVIILFSSVYNIIILYLKIINFDCFEGFVNYHSSNKMYISFLLRLSKDILFFQQNSSGLIPLKNENYDYSVIPLASDYQNTLNDFTLYTFNYTNSLSSKFNPCLNSFVISDFYRLNRGNLVYNNTPQDDHYENLVLNYALNVKTNTSLSDYLNFQSAYNSSINNIDLDLSTNFDSISNSIDFFYTFNLYYHIFVLVLILFIVFLMIMVQVKYINYQIKFSSIFMSIKSDDIREIISQVDKFQTKAFGIEGVNYYSHTSIQETPVNKTNSPKNMTEENNKLISEERTIKSNKKAVWSYICNLLFIFFIFIIYILFLMLISLYVFSQLKAAMNIIYSLNSLYTLNPYIYTSLYNYLNYSGVNYYANPNTNFNLDSLILSTKNSLNYTSNLVENYNSMVYQNLTNDIFDSNLCQFLGNYSKVNYDTSVCSNSTLEGFYLYGLNVMIYNIISSYSNVLDYINLKDNFKLVNSELLFLKTIFVKFYQNVFTTVLQNIYYSISNFFTWYIMLVLIFCLCALAFNLIYIYYLWNKFIKNIMSNESISRLLICDLPLEMIEKNSDIYNTIIKYFA